MKYTVILRRTPECCDLLECDFVEEPTYIAQMESEDAGQAIKQAKLEVLKADKKEAKALGNSSGSHDTDWYELVCVLEGHPKVLVYDFQAREYR